MNISLPLKKALEFVKEGKYEEGKAICDLILEQEANNVNALHSIGLVYYQMKELNKAEECLQKAVSLRPNHEPLQNSLGKVLLAKNKFEDAKACYEIALKLNPSNADNSFNIALSYQEQGLIYEAITHYEKALELDDKYFAAYNNLANIFREEGQSTLAIKNYLKALELEPNNATLFQGLGSSYKRKGELEKAIDCFRRALTLDNRFQEAHSELLDTMLSSSQYTNQEYLQESLKWAEAHAKAIPKHSNYLNTPDPQRRVKIAYLANLQDEANANLLLTLAESHNPKEVEVYCYGHFFNKNKTIERIAQACKLQNISTLNDHSLGVTIKQERIDILIDTIGHSKNARPLLLSQKAAPIQVSYLVSSGLQEIDYRITDSVIDPIGYSEENYRERLARLPISPFCNTALEEVSPQNETPYFKNNFITLAAFSEYLEGISDDILLCWKKILSAFPNSKLIISSRSMNDQNIITELKAALSDQAIDDDRIKLIQWYPSEKRIDLYRQIDLLLDIFPRSNAHIICEGLSQGIVSITLANNLYQSRAGASILSSLNLDNCIANSQERYVEKCLTLANRPAELQRLRSNLPSKLLNSSLGNGKKFCAQLENLYASIWTAWCAKNKKS